MKQKGPSYKAFTKTLSYAYNKAGLPLTLKPVSAFVLHGSDHMDTLSEDDLNEIKYERGRLIIGTGVATMYAPLVKPAIRVLKALDRLYTDGVSITPSLITRIMHAERTHYEDDPLIDKNRFISFTPDCVGAINTYISEVDLRMELEKTFSGASGPIVEYNSKQNAETLESMLVDATTFHYHSEGYYATDIRPSYVKALRHLTNLLYYNLFCFQHVDGHLDKKVVIQGETFIRDILHFHMNRVHILSPSLSLDDF